MAEYKPQGEGAHPTMAGNMLDPNVQADGTLNKGQGVGGTSEAHIREEGLEHIKNNTHSPSAGGISSGSGGLSSSSYADSTGTESTQPSQGIVGTVKSYLGLGGSSAPASSTAPVEARNEGLEGTTAGSGTTGLGHETTGAGDSLAPSATSGNEFDGPISPGTTGGATEGVSGGALGERTLNKGIGTDPAAADTAGRTEPLDSDVTTGAPPTESADPHTSNTAMPEGEQTSGADDLASPASEHTSKLSDADTGSKRENKSAIPTAGGEKLGEKHWGESQVVPDNPKPRASEAGISSEAGQPTSQVRDNTAANTGGAAPPSGSSASGSGEGKEKLVDKIKDKLHIGHKS